MVKKLQTIALLFGVSISIVSCGDSCVAQWFNPDRILDAHCRHF